MDSAYDSYENYKICAEHGIFPVIDLNPRGKKLNKEEINLFSELKIPRSGSSLLRVGNSFYCPATSFPLTKDGKDSTRSNRQKVICRRKGCPLINKCKPNSGNYGRVFYVYPNHELRDFVLRNSGEWKELYNFRSAVERSFSELKDRYLLETPRVRGLMKVWIHALLSLIALIVKRVKDFILKGKLIVVPTAS